MLLELHSTIEAEPDFTIVDSLGNRADAYVGWPNVASRTREYRVRFGDQSQGRNEK